MRTIFPSIVHDIDPPTFKQLEKDFIAYAYKERRTDPVGEEKSNVGGWQSQEIDMRQDDNIKTQFITQEVVSYFQTNRILREGIKLCFSNCWININKKGDYNTKHIHGMSDLSGVFYLKVPKDSGNIKFDSPNEYNQSAEINSYSEDIVRSFDVSAAYVCYPKPGMIFVFPSSLTHCVEVNKSREDRISVSFNIGLL